MDYFHKYDTNPFPDLAWNIPDQKKGSLLVLGGHTQSFKNVVKSAETLAKDFPIEDLKLALPETLKNTLPPLPGLIFLPATDAGSFADSDAFSEIIHTSDLNLLTGDFSKNNITARAVTKICEITDKPTLLTRDTTDLISSGNPERLLMNENLCFFTSIASLKKLLQSVYYPKVILLSQPLMQIAETLHKFTLSYPVSIITFHGEQILVAKNGNVHAVPIEKTVYSALSLMMGDAATKIAAFNLYNPNNFEQATIAALF